MPDTKNNGRAITLKRMQVIEKEIVLKSLFCFCFFVINDLFLQIRVVCLLKMDVFVMNQHVEGTQFLRTEHTGVRFLALFVTKVSYLGFLIVYDLQ